MMFRSIALSCSLLGFLTGGAVMAMDLKEEDARNTPSQKQALVADDSGSAPASKGGGAAPSQELKPFKKPFPPAVGRFFARRLVFWQCLENTGPTNVALVCKDWRTTVNKEMEKDNPGWKAWYGIVGHEKERMYQQFLSGTLLYRPNPQSDVGMITLRIADLPHPLEGTFDLSTCGKTGTSLSISTGYRKGVKPENQNKVEIWIAPRFMIDKKRKSSARHFEPIMDTWNEDVAPVGLFFTWGNWQDLNWYDYLTNAPVNDISPLDLFKNWDAIRTSMLTRFASTNITLSTCHYLRNISCLF